MITDDLYQQISSTIVNGDNEGAAAVVREALMQGIKPMQIIERGLRVGMDEIGVRFSNYEVYLPELMLAAEAFSVAMKILQPLLDVGGEDARQVGRVVIGTVKGDIHSLGKDIVMSMLKARGFEVYDLGVDVPPSRFVDKAEEVDADVICVSALMTTTMPQQGAVIEHILARGQKGKYCVLVGGGATNQEWADQIGAGGYGKTAADAVALALKAVDKVGN